MTRNYSDKMAFSAHLDAMRGVAALVVFASHARNMFFGSRAAAVSAVAQSATIGHPGITGLGSQAVIVFFVLSGYLVGGSVLRGTAAGRWNWQDYLRQRMVRLWIVLIPALLIGAGIDLAGLHLFGNSTLYGGPAGQSVIPPVAQQLGVSVFLGNLFFLQEILVPRFGSNVALWSLANEFWYYMAFPFLVFLFRGPRVSTRIGAAAVLLLTGVFVGKSISFYVLIWLLGAGVSLLNLKMRPGFALRLTGFSLLAFAATSVFARRYSIPEFAAALTLALITSTTIYGCLHQRTMAGPAVYSWLSGALAKMSYSLYLTHLPALVFVSALLVNPWHPWSKDGVHVFGFGCVLLGVFLYSALIYFVFERHTDRLKNAIRKRTEVMVYRVAAPGP